MTHLALFDLDHTLLNIDSDHAWGEFLVRHGLVDAISHRQKNDEFYQDYKNGCLDAVAYNKFVFEFLSQNSLAKLNELHAQFMQEDVLPNMRPKGQDRIKFHQDKGDVVAVITATNRFITAPIVTAFGVSELIATEPELTQLGYTGQLVGVPCVGANKLVHLHTWLNKKSQTFEQMTAYSDSFNDVPLLKFANTAFAICPDKKLHQLAKEQGWQIDDWSL